MEHRDVPTEIPGTVIAGDQPLKLIEFTHSGFGSDAAQTTIPFLDAQDVAPEPAMPLSWINLNYKKNPESSGVIGPGVFTYSYTDHL